MLSKSKIEIGVFKCCKCNMRLENNSTYFPIQLPCFHLICSQCVSSLKMKFFFHCNTLKLFMHTSHKFNEDSKVVFIYDKIKQNELACRIDSLNEFKFKFINSLEQLNKINFDLIYEYLRCKKCNRLYDNNLNVPIRLPCLHSICIHCYDEIKSNSSHFINCPSCLCKFYLSYSSFVTDTELLDLVKVIYSFISKRQSQTLKKIEAFMNDFDVNIEKLSCKLNQDSYEDMIRSCSERSDVIIQEILNEKRNSLLKSLERLSLIKNLSVLDEIKEKIKKIPAQSEIRTSDIELVKASCLYFKKSVLNFNSIKLIGHLKQVGCIKNRIKYLKFNKYFLNFNCQSKQITSPLIQITGFNWIRQCPKADYLISFNMNKIFYIYLNNQYVNNSNNCYHMKLTNSTMCVKMIESSYLTKMKVQYCRGYDRIVLILFEKNYEKDYELRVYDSATLDFIAKTDFPYFIENACVNSKEIVTWSSEKSPYIKLYDYNLTPTESNRVNYDLKIFDKYYLLPDFTNKILVFHNQNFIGLVSRNNGEIVHEINLCDYRDEIDEIRENEHQVRNRSYLSQTKSEYLNLKCYNEDYLIVTTWSKIYLFKLNEHFDLLVKNDLFCILNNNWYIPNRLYINNDGYISFFDPSSSFITFI